MILIVRGPIRLLRVSLERYQQSGALRLDREALLPWGGARRLWGQLHAILGDKPLQHALTPHRLLLSLVLRGLGPLLTEEEKAERERASGSTLGFLPHTSLTAKPLAEAWASVFARLLRDLRATLLVEDISQIDPESLVMLRSLRRQLGERISIIIGHDPSHSPPDPILRRLQDLQRAELSCLEVLPGSLTEQVFVPFRIEGRLPTAPETFGPFDDAAEHKALQSQSSEELFTAARASFGSFSFAAASWFAKERLKRVTSRKEAVELRTILGVSLRMLSSPGEPDEEASAHLKAALQGETDPARRSHLLYCLSIEAARRKEAERAYTLAEEARQEAQVVPSAALSSLLEAWAYNARAYALFRQGELFGARSDCTLGLGLLQGQRSEPLLTTQRQALSFHLYNNLARLSFLLGERAEAQRYQEMSSAWYASIPWEQRGPFVWRSVELDTDDLSESILRYRARRERARRDLEPHEEAACCLDLGELYSRQGNAEAAFACFDRASHLWETLSPGSALLQRAFLRRANAAFRAGLFEEAEHSFEDLIAHSEEDSLELHAGLLMLLAAKRSPQVSAQLTATYELLSQCTAPAQKRRALRALAETHLLLEQKQEARELFARLFYDEERAQREERLAALGGLWVLGALPEAPLFDTLEGALGQQDNPDFAWELPRILSLLLSLLQERPDEQRLQKLASDFSQIAAHRYNCQDETARLREALASSARPRALSNEAQRPQA